MGEFLSLAYAPGGAVASWLVRSSPDRAVRVRALAFKYPRHVKERSLLNLFLPPKITVVSENLHLKRKKSKGSAHTTLEEFKSVALFLRLDLPSTLIRQKNGAFRKRASNRGGI